VLIAAGTVRGYEEVRGWSGLWETTYGLLLLAKIALVLPLLALGAYNNRYAVPRLKEGIASVLERRRFLRAAGVELGIMVAIVAVTAVLVNAEPARTEMGMEMEEEAAHTESPTESTGGHEAFQGMVMLGDSEVMVMVDPAMPGENMIRLTFTTPLENVTRVSASASLPSQNIGPLAFEAEPDPAEPGTYVIENASLSIAGEWELRIEALQGEFDLLTETIAVPIGEE
jgi:copper transport protein